MYRCTCYFVENCNFEQKKITKLKIYKLDIIELVTISKGPASIADNRIKNISEYMYFSLTLTNNKKNSI